MNVRKHRQCRRAGLGVCSVVEEAFERWNRKGCMTYSFLSKYSTCWLNASFDCCSISRSLGRLSSPCFTRVGRLSSITFGLIAAAVGFGLEIDKRRGDTVHEPCTVDTHKSAHGICPVAVVIILAKGEGRTLPRPEAMLSAFYDLNRMYLRGMYLCPPILP